MPRSRSKPADALELLKEDHERVKKAFREFEKLERGDDQRCRELVRTTCADLRVHTTLEEELFYPAARETVDDEDLLNEAAVEHETARMLIDQLENMDPDDPNYRATFTVLGEYVLHHIKEEEGELFPQTKKAEDLDLDELGERMRARKGELTSEQVHA